jgi:hypothetical protein
MDVGSQSTAKVVDFAAYRERRQQPILWEEPQAERPAHDSGWPRRDESLSDRQLTHRRRMLAFLLTPR